MTWKEVKLATLQKMFSAEGLTINEADDSVSEYINAMPQAANEGLQLLCTAGKYLRRCLELEPGAAGETRTVDLKTAAPDLYRIEQLEVYAFDEAGAPVPVRGAKLVAGRYLVLTNQPESRMVLYYNAWPQPVTHATADDRSCPWTRRWRCCCPSTWPASSTRTTTSPWPPCTAMNSRWPSACSSGRTPARWAASSPAPRGGGEMARFSVPAQPSRSVLHVDRLLGVDMTNDPRQCGQGSRAPAATT